jgi:shikimate kinase
VNYFICGFSGAGKSTLLQELAANPELKRFECIDLDDYILKRVLKYKTLGELIESEGFDFFRMLERKALVELDQKEKLIVSLGGGTLGDKTEKILTAWTGLWLGTDFETCYARIHGDANRPLASLDKEVLLELYEDRKKRFLHFKQVSKVSDCLSFFTI